MSSRKKFRQRTHFRGNVYFGYSGGGEDVTFYGNTTNAYAQWDASDNRFEITPNGENQGLSVSGWSNLGWTSASAVDSYTAAVGSVRFVYKSATTAYLVFKTRAQGSHTQFGVASVGQGYAAIEMNLTGSLA